MEQPVQVVRVPQQMAAMVALKEAILVAAEVVQVVLHQQVVLAVLEQEMQVVLEAQEGPQEVAMVVLEAQGIPATVLLVKFPVEVAAVPMVVQQQMEPEGTLPLLIPVA